MFATIAVPAPARRHRGSLVSAFSVNEFYQRNRRVVIWVILFGLLWLLRDFFAVVFLSFVLAIVAASDFYFW